jgi:hypothetical protein
MRQINIVNSVRNTTKHALECGLTTCIVCSTYSDQRLFIPKHLFPNAWSIRADEHPGLLFIDIHRKCGE